MIYLQLFLSFFKVGLFSVGGGYAAMPLIQSLVVDKYSWLTISEFTDLVTIAEMTPGPIAINGATFAGIRVAGVPGAITATLGYVLPSIIIVSLLSYIYYKFKTLSAIQSVLKSLRPAVVALIASAGLTILLNVLFGTAGITLSSINICAAVLFILSFVAIRKLKLSPILTMVLCGVIYTVVNVIIK